MMVRDLKSILPRWVRRPLGRLRALGWRIGLWTKVAAGLSGAGPQDRAILRHALLRAPVSIWRNLDEWQFPMVDRDCTVVSRGVGRFHIRARTDDLFHVLPGQEPAVERTIRGALAPGRVFVDAGSNIGFYTLLAARLVGDEGQVIACEMMPETAAVLRRHLALNGADRVRLVEGALAETAGQTVWAEHPDSKFGQASIARSAGGRRCAVTTTTLQEILQDVPRVDVMKMDLEGAELGALKGLGPALDRIDLIVFENRNAPEVIDWLSERGFQIARLDGNNAAARRRG